MVIFLKGKLYDVIDSLLWSVGLVGVMGIKFWITRQKFYKKTCALLHMKPYGNQTKKKKNQMLNFHCPLR